MPFKSRAQAKYFFEAMSKKKGLGDLSQTAATKFVNDSKGQKLDILPNYTPKLPKTPRFAKLKTKIGKY